ncbi:MAG TPA: hypothetical protein VHC70_03975, partial [Phycisphaerales bacterium]|nr:hypothetical protein [Phycisphaerales bacterium]
AWDSAFDELHVRLLRLRRDYDILQAHQLAPASVLPVAQLEAEAVRKGTTVRDLLRPRLYVRVGRKRVPDRCGDSDNAAELYAREQIRAWQAGTWKPAA